MRRKILVPVLALAATLAACERADMPTAPPPGPSENLLGGLLGLLGWITDPVLRALQLGPTTSVTASANGGGKATAAGGAYHYAFSAARRSDGSTKGHAKLRIGSTRYDADVTCLGVRGDTEVIVGVVRSSSDAGAVGDTLVFTAVDGADRIGEPEFPAAGQAGTRCASVTPGATLAVDAGQVRVSGNTYTGPVVVATVTGMGSFVFDGFFNLNFQTNITRLSDGTVSGEYREEDADSGEFAVLEVSCVTLDGDTAYVGGTITASSTPTLVGTEDGLILVDNAPATPDRISGLAIAKDDAAQEYCNGARSLPLFDLTPGDIAITP